MEYHLVVSPDVADLARGAAATVDLPLVLPSSVTGPDDVQLTRLRLAMHLGVFTRALNATDVAAAEVEYSGRNDEGYCEEPRLMLADGPATREHGKLMRNRVPLVRCWWKGCSVVCDVAFGTLQSLILEIFELATACVGIQDWEVGAGATGTARIAVGASHVEFGHTQFRTESDFAVLSTAPAQPAFNPRPAVAALQLPATPG